MDSPTLPIPPVLPSAPAAPAVPADLARPPPFSRTPGPPSLRPRRHIAMSEGIAPGRHHDSSIVTRRVRHEMEMAWARGTPGRAHGRRRGPGGVLWRLFVF